MSTIRKRTWVYKGVTKSAWVVDYKDNGGNRRLKTFTKKKDAEKYIASVRYELAEGTHVPDTQSITISRAGELWIERAKRESLEEATIATYDSIVRLHIVPLIGDVKINRLTVNMVESLRASLLKTTTRSTADRTIRHLVMLIEFAIEAGFVGRNVAKKVTRSLPARYVSQVIIPEKHELRQFMRAADSCKNLAIKVFALLLVFAGLRASEIRGLTWRSVKLERGTLRIIKRADRKRKLGPPKSKAGSRSIPLAPSLQLALAKLKDERQPNPDDLVFQHESGRPLSWHEATERLLDPFLRAANLADPKLDSDGTPLLGADGEPILAHRYGMHAFRHACASLWIEKGYDAKKIQKWMGHWSIQVTFDLYGHLFDEAQADTSGMELIERDLRRPAKSVVTDESISDCDKSATWRSEIPEFV